MSVSTSLPLLLLLATILILALAITTTCVHGNTSVGTRGYPGLMMASTSATDDHWALIQAQGNVRLRWSRLNQDLKDYEHKLRAERTTHPHAEAALKFALQPNGLITHLRQISDHLREVALHRIALNYHTCALYEMLVNLRDQLFVEGMPARCSFRTKKSEINPKPNRDACKLLNIIKRLSSMPPTSTQEQEHHITACLPVIFEIFDAIPTLQVGKKVVHDTFMLPELADDDFTTPCDDDRTNLSKRLVGCDIPPSASIEQQVDEALRQPLAQARREVNHIVSRLGWWIGEMQRVRWRTQTELAVARRAVTLYTGITNAILEHAGAIFRSYVVVHTVQRAVTKRVARFIMVDEVELLAPPGAVSSVTKERVEALHVITDAPYAPMRVRLLLRHRLLPGPSIVHTELFEHENNAGHAALLDVSLAMVKEYAAMTPKQRKHVSKNLNQQRKKLKPDDPTQRSIAQQLHALTTVDQLLAAL
jgi:hypothetical protein